MGGSGFGSRRGGIWGPVGSMGLTTGTCTAAAAPLQEHPVELPAPDVRATVLVAPRNTVDPARAQEHV